MSESVLVSTHIKKISENLQEKTKQVEHVESWIDVHGLDRLENTYEIVSRQAVYNTILKSTLYRTYQREYNIDEIEKYDDPDTAFETALEVTSDPAFDSYVLDRVSENIGYEEWCDIVEFSNRLLDVETPSETIGSIFEDIVPQSSRRKLGQFRTPEDIAELMSNWVVNESNDTVLDSGIGAGILSSYCYNSKKEKGSDVSLSEIYGVDKSQLSLVMSTTSLRLENGGDKPNITAGDFFEYEQEPADAIISNPPYTRHHELEDEYKKELNREIEEIAGHELSSLSPLYSYFFIKASQFVKEGGKMVFITPSEFLETNYGESLKQFLLDNFRIHGMVLYDRGSESQFEEALTTSCITFLENKKVEEQDTISFIRVDKRMEIDEIINSVNNGDSGETGWGFVNKIHQYEIDSSDKWSNFFDPISTVSRDELAPLSDIGTIKRGIATGDNDFFCLSENEVDEWGIEKEYLSKLIRKNSHISGYKYDQETWERNKEQGNEVWIIYHVDTWKDSLRNSNSWEYLDYGEEKGADDSYLARNREPWYVIDRREPADIVFTYMSREGVKFIHNETKARNLNNLHSIYLDDDLDGHETKALLAYLNSNIADEIVRRSGRTYSTGMDKVEPDELKQVPVIDPRNLGGETVEELSSLFEELHSSDDEEQTLSKIDTIIESNL